MNYRDEKLPSTGDWIDQTVPEGLSAVLADTRWPDGALAAMQLAQRLNIAGVMMQKHPCWKQKPRCMQPVM